MTGRGEPGKSSSRPVGRRSQVLTGTKNQGQKRWYCQVKETKLAGRVAGSLSRFIVPFESREI
jgi:hypothetical protein